MRHITLSILLGAALLNAGCSSLVSLRPAASAEEAVSVPSLAGTWVDKEDKDFYVVREKTPGVYEIRYDNEKFEAIAFTIGAARYLDVRPLSEYPFQVPAHAIVRFWLNGAELRWGFVDSEWIRARVAERKLAAVMVEKTMVLTDTTENVRAVLAEHGGSELAYKDVTTLKRL